MRPFLVEGAALAVLSGAAAALVAAILSKAIWLWLLPTIDWPARTMALRVLYAGGAATIIVGAAVGVLLSRQARDIDVALVLKAGNKPLHHRRLSRQTLLTVAQCCLAVLLLAGAGLFVRSLVAAMRVDYGIDTRRTYVASIEWSGSNPRPGATADKTEWNAHEQILSDVVNRLRASRTVETVALAAGMPFRGAAQIAIKPVSSQVSPGVGGRFVFFSVGDDYFSTVGTRVIQGRPFGLGDQSQSQRVVILSRTLAQRFWPTGAALGQCVTVESDSLPCAVVVGVAQDVSDLHGQPKPALYLPIQQAPPLRPSLIVLRPRRATPGIADDVRAALFSVDGGIRYVDVASLHDFVEPQLKSWELGSLLFGLMAALALTIAGVGLFATVSYDTVARTKEIAIRRALGAGPTRVLILVARPSVLLSSIGVLMGVAGVIAVKGLVSPLLYTARGVDVFVLAGVCATLLLVAFAASIIPAARINRRSPAEILRVEE